MLVIKRFTIEVNCIYLFMHIQLPTFIKTQFVIQIIQVWNDMRVSKS